MRSLIRQQLFIGCNVGNVPTHTIDTIATKLYEQGLDSFTLTESVGHWQGQQEKSIIVTLFSLDDVSLTEVQIKDLADNLQQDCILWTVEGTQGGFTSDDD